VDSVAVAKTLGDLTLEEIVVETPEDSAAKTPAPICTNPPKALEMPGWE